MLSLVPKNHIALTGVNEAKAISASLFEHFGLQSMLFTRHYHTKKKTITSISTNAELFKATIDNVSSIRSTVVLKRFSEFTIFQESVSLIKKPELKSVYERQIQIQNDMVQGGVEMCIAKHYPSYIDTFDLIAHRDDVYAMNRFMHNFDLLDIFISYFYDKAKPLIDRAEKQKIVYQHEPYKYLYDSISDFSLIDREAFINDHPVKTQYFINNEGQVKKFTKVEIQTIDALLLGHTTSAIATLLCVSPRTIESRINNIKNKTGCYKKSDLIQFLLKLKVPQL